MKRYKQLFPEILISSSIPQELRPEQPIEDEEKDDEEKNKLSKFKIIKK